MKYYYWASSLLLFAVVQYSAVAFKIPGLSSGTTNRSPPPTAGNRATGTNGGGHRVLESEYMGPVFIIRELDKEKGEYDAFVTTGGIQEVRPPPMSDRSLPPQHGNHPAAGYRDDEDAEYFGVLVTPETVKQLNADEKLKASFINVTMSVLLSVGSSRMPWLLVLHRKNYPHLFEYHQQQPFQSRQYQVQHPLQQQHQQQHQQQQQQHQQQQQQQQHQQQYFQQDAAQADGVPGLQNPQIPQRRRYQTDRQRRAVLQYDDDFRAPPIAFEQQVLSTMCYNFVRDYYSDEQSALRLPIALADTAAADYSDDRRQPPEPEQYGRYRQDVYLDADAYAAAATAGPSGRVQKSQSAVPITPEASSSSAAAARPGEQQPAGGVVDGMAIPKRVS